MIRTVITPENHDVSIHISENYVGREIEVTVFAVDELKNTDSFERKKPSDFRGKLRLTDEQYQDFQNHLKNIRNEWDRGT